ncbi:MAG: TiaS agmantine-binding domain-containing protein [Halobacteriota archaeon]
MLIGIDDTDSQHGMCTTYLGAVLKTALERHLRENVRLHLVRLNPTIRFKTRGNAAVGITTQSSYGVKDIVQAHIEDMACMHDENTHPGAVFIDCNTPPPDIQRFSYEATRRELDISYAIKLIERNNVDFLTYKKGRGLIGALAAAGATLETEDHTYELITYRYARNHKKQRYINRESVYQADKVTYPYTWDTIDHKNSTIVFSPRSRDPVLYGIRGDDPYHVFAAQSKIISEPYEYMVLYVTNQGTDKHIRHEQIDALTEGCSYVLTGTITVAPWTIEGGHIFFQIGEPKRTLVCVAFEPTKQFRAVVRKLCEGDRVTVQGSFIRDCLHLEKLRIVELQDQFRDINPICCNKRMKSRGRGKGFKCVRCKTIKRQADTKEPIAREIALGMYEVATSARRHLAKPLIRDRCVGHPIFPSR